MEQKNGTIELNSEPDVGTVVHIILPLSIVPLKENQSTKESPDAAFDMTDSEGELSGRKLLLAEDNELNIEIARFMLEDAGAQVTVAKDGAQAVDAYLSEPEGTFAAVLMDLMMPVMDGCEAARRIRAAHRADAKRIPIIATTACVSDEARTDSRNAGMNAFLEKPLDMERVIRMIVHLAGPDGRIGEKA